jgi:hypothetical protein
VCVYCGHHGAHSDFVTHQQLERAKRAVGDWAEQLVGRTLDRSLRPLATGSVPRSGIGLQVTYRSTPFYPRPLPGISEEKLIRVRTCVACSLRYAVFGEHRYCPVCGALGPRAVALDALAAEVTRLDVLRLVPAEAAAALRESGALNRVWVDTLENLVGIVETLAKTVFRAAVPDAAARTKRKSHVFQRLADLADLFVDAGYPDIRSLIDAATWQRLLQVWATRHLFTHNDGVIDEKYAASSPGGTLKIGQRVTVTEAACRQAIADVQTLATTIAGITSA